MIAEPETIEMIKNEGFHAATEQLKKEGRLKFVGVAHHGSQLGWSDSKEPMEKILLAAAEDGRFDVVLLAYNFLKEDMSERVLEVCSQKNIGTTLMKVNPIRTYYFMLKQDYSSDESASATEFHGTRPGKARYG
jgi:predicted aldo/keto reductase-like oxidoreductase